MCSSTLDATTKERRTALFQLDVKNRKSIYEQVIDSFKEEIVSGVLAPGEKMPSVRDLSKQLTINPNTVQKAYRELEREGYCYTVSGLGTFVAKPEQITRDDEKIGELKTELARLIQELRYQNVSPDEIRDAVDVVLTNRGEPK